MEGEAETADTEGTGRTDRPRFRPVLHRPPGAPISDGTGKALGAVR